MTAATPPVLAADLEAGLRRLKLAAMRRIAPDLLVTAKTSDGPPRSSCGLSSTRRSPPVTRR